MYIRVVQVIYVAPMLHASSFGPATLHFAHKIYDVMLEITFVKFTPVIFHLTLFRQFAPNGVTLITFVQFTHVVIQITPKMLHV